MKIQYSIIALSVLVLICALGLTALLLFNIINIVCFLLVLVLEGISLGILAVNAMIVHSHKLK